MKRKAHSLQYIGLPVLLLLLNACAPSQPTAAPIAADTSAAATQAPVQPAASVYQPVSAEVCQILQESATESLGLTFTMETGTPFTDFASGETGLGCTLTATTNGTVLSGQYDAVAKLVNGFVGWTENPLYAADGPTGTAIGLNRDSGLMLISVGWQPAVEANCPTDQPISACELTPEQRLYTVKIEAAQK
jgi:hypothetical protein